MDQEDEKTAARPPRTDTGAGGRADSGRFFCHAGRAGGACRCHEAGFTHLLCAKGQQGVLAQL